jgi:hypothetical protein
MAGAILADRIIVMNPIEKFWWTAKAVGWDNLPRRVLQMLRARSGLLRKRLAPELFSQESFQIACRTTPDEQSQLWADRAKSFFAIPDREALQSVADDSLWDREVTEICNKALDGQHQFFSHWFGQLGWPPNFNRDPVHDIDWPVGEHWLSTARSGPPRDDIKLVWEASRFTLGYHFARAYRRSGQEKWAQAFWEMFDAWIAQNPPQLTVGWGCGQEIAFRLMAMLTGAFATLDSPSATDERLYALSRFAWQAARRIEVNINYARSQKNNHAFSEALGLWTVGLLFPEFEPAEKWRDKGRDILAAEAGRQIYDDGSYVQHSLSYHRVMIDDLLWAIQLGRINDQPLGDIVIDRFARATAWLGQMLDPDSGCVVNYGANDGANILPLACCDYLDYRPTIQAASILTDNNPCLPTGPWDEKALWLFGSKSLEAPIVPIVRDSEFSAPDGGYYILRGPNSWTMTRCCTYKDRPNQADMLHVDLWYKGVNVLRDAGSYMYYCPEPWKHYFHSTAAHNTIEIDGQDQMTKGPRFLWFHWTKSDVVRFESQGDRSGLLEASHHGYRRLPGPVDHKRTVRRIGDVYSIEDTLTSRSPQMHQAIMRWRLCAADWRQDAEDKSWRGNLAGGKFSIRIACSDDFTCRLTSGSGEGSVEGWESLYYGRKTQVPILLSTVQFKQESRFITLLGPTEQIEDEMLNTEDLLSLTRCSKQSGPEIIS